MSFDPRRPESPCRRCLELTDHADLDAACVCVGCRDEADALQKAADDAADAPVVLPAARCARCGSAATVPAGPRGGASCGPCAGLAPTAYLPRVYEVRPASAARIAKRARWERGVDALIAAEYARAVREQHTAGVA